MTTKRPISRSPRRSSSLAKKDERPRLIVMSRKDRLSSKYLQRLAANLTSRLALSEMTKPEFAAEIGMSGAQFRHVRARLANPTIRMLATVASNLSVPLYELLENKKLGRRLDASADEMILALANTVRSEFQQSGVTNAEFAASIGVSVPQLYLIIRGVANPSLLAAEEIAKRLDKGLWQLLGVEHSGYSDGSPTKPRAKARGRSVSNTNRKTVATSR
jgi:transcriptional regulator with XRE-family HTH domain